MNQIMPGQIEIPQAFIDRVAEWFCASFGDPYHNPRMAKSLGLYQLAGLVTDGVIVELGAYHGNGAYSLAAGAQGRRRVYTVDDYNHRRDWMGNEPDGKDRDILIEHIAESGLPIEWVNQSVTDAARGWTEPIGLIHWDTGNNTLMADFAAWSPHLVRGGMFTVHDTDNHTFRSDELLRLAQEAGWLLGPEFRTLYTVVKP